MYSTTRRRLLLLALAATAVLALAACSSESTGPAPTPLTQGDANAAADVVVSDLSDQADGATTTTSGASFSLATALSNGPSQSVSALGASPWYTTACSPPPTVTTNGSTITYVFDHCAISRLVPLETLTRTGEVDVTLEPGSRVVAFKGFQRTWERISFRTGQTITTSATQDGTRSISGDGTTLEFHSYGSGDPATSLFQTDFVHEDQSTSRHERNWQSQFTADVAGSIALNQPLPSGLWSLNGTSTWLRNLGSANQKSWTFTTTAPSVHYDPACTSAPQFDAGTMTVTASNGQNGNTSQFTITFTDCGKYSVVISH
jgi:hypothetical protein